jgi:hypothetical protein
MIFKNLEASNASLNFVLMAQLSAGPIGPTLSTFDQLCAGEQVRLV